MPNNTWEAYSSSEHQGAHLIPLPRWQSPELPRLSTRQRGPRPGIWQPSWSFTYRCSDIRQRLKKSALYSSVRGGGRLLEPPPPYFEFFCSAYGFLCVQAHGSTRRALALYTKTNQVLNRISKLFALIPVVHNTR